MGEARGIPDDLHIHTTTEVRGAVLPAWFVAILLIFFVLMSSGMLYVGWKVDRIATELWLLDDFTRGRISHMPYRPSEARGNEQRRRGQESQDHRGQ